MVISTTAAVSLGIAAAGASAAGQIASSKMQSNAAKRAGKEQSAAANEALAWEKEQEEVRRKEYLEERERNWLNEDEDRKLAALDRQLALAELARKHELQRPYQDFGGRSVATLQQLMSPGSNMDYRVAQMPQGAPQAAPQMAPQMMQGPPPGPMPGAMPPPPPGTIAQLAGRRP
jgi:hypothetical protein